MLSPWLYIGVFALIAMFLPAVAITIAGFLSPKKPNRIKNSTYECGMETVGPSKIQFKVQYYVYTLVFLIFDVEVVCCYPGR